MIGWPSQADEELASVVSAVATFELANDSPAIVEDGTGGHLAWRGYLTGGLLTLYEQVAGLISERGLSAFYADPRLEVFVPAEGDVVVLGALRHPVRLPREEWDARVAAADSGEDLAAGFIHEALAGADLVVSEARRAAEEHSPGMGAPFPEAIEPRPPGEVDFDLLDDSDFELTERYDPEGNPDETWVSCQVLRWRTDFVPRGVTRTPDRVLEEALKWRVTQWEWIEEPSEDELEDEEREGELEGEWALRAHAPIAAADVAGHLPPGLRPWVRRATEDAVSWFTDVEDEWPELVGAARRLQAELDDLS